MGLFAACLLSLCFSFYVLSLSYPALRVPWMCIAHNLTLILCRRLPEVCSCFRTST